MQRQCGHIHDEYHRERRTGPAQPIEPDGISLQKANTKRPHDQQLAFGGMGGGDPEGPLNHKKSLPYIHIQHTPSSHLLLKLFRLLHSSGICWHNDLLLEN